MKPIIPILIILTFATLSFIGCKAPDIITNIETKDSVIYRQIPKYIEVPAKFTKSPPLNIDSLATLIRSGIKPEVIIYTDTTGNVSLKLIIDKLGNLTAVCEQQEQRIQYLQNQIEHYKSITAREHIIEKKPFWEKMKEIATIVISTLVVAAISYFIFKIVI